MVDVLYGIIDSPDLEEWARKYDRCPQVRERQVDLYWSPIMMRAVVLMLVIGANASDGKLRTYVAACIAKVSCWSLAVLE
jgi:hypothetical protein